MPLSISILAYSDLDTVADRKPLWGDYWFKHHLQEALSTAGLVPASDPSDVVIHLFGAPVARLPKTRLRILWLHSHPDRITPDILARYDLVLCTSKPFARRLACSRQPAEWLMMPTHMKPTQATARYPLVFVGNNRRDGLRKVIGYLLEQKNALPAVPAVWGDGWEGVVPDSWYRGRFVPNEELNLLYAASALVLNDHHDDMAREGFLNPRILDATAAGSLVITDPVLGLRDLAEFPVYRNSAELAEHIRYLLNHPATRTAMQEAAWKRLSAFTYAHAAGVLAEKIRERLG